jgi:hypothetical protein
MSSIDELLASAKTLAQQAVASDTSGRVSRSVHLIFFRHGVGGVGGEMGYCFIPRLSRVLP